VEGAVFAVFALFIEYLAGLSGDAPAMKTSITFPAI
jgi:hypothetical protein